MLHFVGQSTVTVMNLCQHMLANGDRASVIVLIPYSGKQNIRKTGKQVIRKQDQGNMTSENRASGKYDIRKQGIREILRQKTGNKEI